MASIRKLPSGDWRALVRIRGFPPHSGTFRTKAQAERWTVVTEDQIHSGSFRDTGAAERRLLSEHLAWYFATLTPWTAPSALSREASCLVLRLTVWAIAVRIRIHIFATLAERP